MTKRLLALGTLLFLCQASVAGAATIVSTFDSGLEGWTTNDFGTFTHQATGGNPGGFLFLDNSEVSIAQIIAPSSFLGNLSAYVGGTLSFDGNLLANGGAFFDGPNKIPDGNQYLDYGIIQLIGPTLNAQVDLLPNGTTAPLGSWQTYSVSLNAANWGLSPADFATLLQDVTSLRITMEGLYGAEQQGIDNIRLQSSVSTVPEPTSLLLLGTGLISVGVQRWRKHTR